MSPDIDIITRPGRDYATLFANTMAAEGWIAGNIARPLCRSMACFGAPFVDEFKAAAEKWGLSVRVCGLFDLVAGKERNSAADVAAARKERQRPDQAQDQNDCPNGRYYGANATGSRP